MLEDIIEGCEIKVCNVEQYTEKKWKEMKFRVNLNYIRAMAEGSCNWTILFAPALGFVFIAVYILLYKILNFFTVK